MEAITDTEKVINKIIVTTYLDESNNIKYVAQDAINGHMAVMHEGDNWITHIAYGKTEGYHINDPAIPDTEIIHILLDKAEL